MKKIHFIGICGVAMSALSIAFKKAGFEVTGSDVGFFPPVSTNLEKHKIKFYPGWHPNRMIENGTPDLVVIGNVASSTNPEWLFVQENKLNYLSYPEAIEKYFVKENSIVCAGTYGKTTTSALLSFVLTECGYHPSYMFGGIAIDEFDSACLPPPLPLLGQEGTTNDWSVLEGDEYKSSKWDDGAKFFHYHPTHLLLTAVEWDHADVYPTAESYFQAFEKLIKSVPEKGMIVASEHVTHITNHITNLITYGELKTNNYQYTDVKQNKDGLKFKIMVRDMCYVLRASLLGEYNAENICGAFALAHQIGIEPEKIISAIDKFKGLKRRLEKRFENENVTIFDDIAHSPAKAKSVLENLRIHSERSEDTKIIGDWIPASAGMTAKKIICIFEPNTGNRQPQSEQSYDNAFENADEVIIPKLTKLKTSKDLKHWEGNELVGIISKTHKNTKYIEKDEELVTYLANQKNVIIVFCGSHGFRGMIDLLISSFRVSEATRNLL